LGVAMRHAGSFDSLKRGCTSSTLSLSLVLMDLGPQLDCPLSPSPLRLAPPIPSPGVP
jgi:hypothetical protein